MRIGILVQGQAIWETPREFIGKKILKLYLRKGYTLLSEKHPDLGIKLIQAPPVRNIRASLPSSDTQRFAKPRIRVSAHITKKIDREPEGLVLTYPVPDQSSYAAQHRQEIWGWDTPDGKPVEK